MLADGTLKARFQPGKVLRAPGDDAQLSNETTLTRFSEAKGRAPIRRRPSADAKAFSRTRYLGPSNTLAIWALLRGHVDERGNRWYLVRIQGRPNGRTGWVRARALTRPRIVTTQIVVDRRSLRFTFFRRGQQRLSGPVGVGAARTPTPAGHFFIARKAGAIFGPVYGPNILFTTAASSLADWPGGGYVGMHGTNQPGLVPGRPSHGCIRLHNADIRRLARKVPVGTPLLIR